MAKAKKEAKPALNLRDVPAELMARLKTDAAKGGRTLRDHCISILTLSEMVDVVSMAPVATKPEVERIAAALPVTVASQLPSPPPKEGHPPGRTAGRCWKCDAILIPFGPGQMRCRTCATNYPAA